MKLSIITYKSVSFNVICIYLNASLISLNEFQSNLQDISNFINDEPFDDILIIGKKLMVSDVFKNTANPPLGLPPLGEVLGVAGVKHAIVLLSVNWSSSLAVNWVNNVS